MKVEGIDFNDQWVRRFDNADAFAAHKNNQILWAGKPAEVRIQLLKLVFNLVKMKDESNH